jgi:hypothetical protein
MKTIFSIFTAVFFLVAFSTISNARTSALPPPDMGGPGTKIIKSSPGNLNKSLSGKVKAGSTALPEPSAGGGGGKTIKSSSGNLNKSVSGKIKPGSTALPNPALGGGGTRL